MKASRVARLFVAFLLLAMAGMQAGKAQAALPAQVVQNDQVVTRAASAGEQAATLNFWTKDMMARAKPLPMPVDYGTPPGPSAAKAAPAVTGAMGYSAPGLADPATVGFLQKAYAADWKEDAASGNAAPVTAAPADVAVTGAPMGTAEVYTSYVVNQWQKAQKIYPHVWVGRLYVITSGGIGYCSATAIAGNNIVTAAHCLYDLDSHSWYTGWVFAPAYRDGKAPYGNFVAGTCTILNAWTTQPYYSIDGATQYDVGVCTMGTNSKHKTLNNSVGWAGQMWNYGYVRNFHDLGYPWQDTDGNTLVDAGKFLRLCTAESFYAYTDVVGMGCNWGPGISGGPWMAYYAPPLVSGYVGSVNSGYYSGHPDLFGIRFTDYNERVLCSYRGC